MVLVENYKSLSITERIHLVEDIWDSIAADATTALSPAQQQLLDAREQEALAGIVSTKSWEEIELAVLNRNGA